MLCRTCWYGGSGGPSSGGRVTRSLCSTALAGPASLTLPTHCAAPGMTCWPGMSCPSLPLPFIAFALRCLGPSAPLPFRCLCPSLPLPFAAFATFALRYLCPSLPLPFAASVLRRLCPSPPLPFAAFALHCLCPSLPFPYLAALVTLEMQWSHPCKTIRRRRLLLLSHCT